MDSQQTLHAFYAFVEGLDEHDNEGMKKIDLQYWQSASILAKNCLVCRMQGMPGEHAIITNLITAILFGQYLANLERDEQSLTVDEHDGTVLNIIPFAGGYSDNRPQS